MVFDGLVLIVAIMIFGAKNLLQPKSSTPIEVASYASFLGLVLIALVSIEQPGLGIWLYFFAGINLSVIFSKATIRSAAIDKTFAARKLVVSIFIVFFAVGSASLFNSAFRLAGDIQLRSSVQTIVSGNGTIDDVEKVIGLSGRLKAEPEYTAQALTVVASIGDAKALDTVSMRTYEYFPNSMQAKLIRAEVLRAIGREEESCPIRFSLVRLTPWDSSQVLKYFNCLSAGNSDVEISVALEQIEGYLSKTFPLTEGSEFQLLKSYSVNAYFDFLSGKDESAKASLNRAVLLLEVLESAGFEKTIGPSDLADYQICKNLIRNIKDSIN
jgi:hypothetical protein